MQKIYYVSSILFLVLSLLLYLQMPVQNAHFDVDSYGYQELAISFVQYGHMINTNYPLYAPVQPLGYPFFMGLIYRLFGSCVALLIVIQIVLMSVSIALIICTTQQLFGPLAAVIAAMLSVTNIAFLVYPQFVLAETVLLFLLILSCAFIVRYIQTQSLFLLIGAGTVLGSSVLVKPTALFLPCIIIPLIITTCNNNRRSWITAIIFCVCFSMPIILYMFRNYLLYGYFDFAPMMALNMYQCFLAKVINRITGEPIQSVVDHQLRFSAINSFDPTGWNQAANLFAYYIKQYPFTFIYVWMINVTKTVFGLFSTQLKVLVEPLVHGGDCSFFLTSGPLAIRLYTYVESGITHTWLRCIAWGEVLWSIIRIFLVMIGFIYMYAEKKYGLLIIFVLCIMLLCLITGMDGCCRYRIVCEPLLIMITSYAIACIWHKKRIVV